jgi:hypothetical protein
MANYHEHCRRLDAERAEFAALFTRPAVHRCVDCRNDIPAESRALARTRGGLCGRCYVLPESIDFPRVLARISRTHSYQRTGRITVVDEHDLREEGAEVGGSGWHWSDGRVVPHHTQWREIEKGERARAADPKGFCVACFCERPTSKHARREELNGKCELCHETGRPAVEVTGGRVGPYCAGYVAPVAPPVPAPVEKAPAPAPILTPKQAQKAANKAKHDKRRAVEAQAAAERAAKQAAEDRADRLAYAMDVANERRQLETAAVVWNAEAERADVTDRRAPRKPGATVTVRVPDDRAKRLRAKARGEKLAKLAKAAAAKPAPTEAPAPTEPPAIHGRRERTPDEARRLADGVEILRKLDGFGHLSEGRARRGLSRILDLWAVSRERAVFQAGKAWFSPTVWGNDEKRAKLTTAIVEALATIAATRRAREEAAQEQQRTPTPVEEVRAAAFAEMVDVADRVLGFGLLRAEIETGVRAAAKAWTLSGFHRSEVGPIAEALFGNYPTKVASVEHARRREVEMMLWALEPIALCAAAEVAAAANGDVFCEPSPELIAEVRDRVNGLTEERARSGLLIALAHWDGDRVSPEAEVHLTRAWFGTHDAKNARRAWQILTEVAG